MHIRLIALVISICIAIATGFVLYKEHRYPNKTKEDQKKLRNYYLMLAVTATSLAIVEFFSIKSIVIGVVYTVFAFMAFMKSYVKHLQS